MAGHMFRRAAGGTIAIDGAGEGRHDAGCFADEVVIDFPSVLPAVDRIREAFLAGERAAALSTFVQIGADDARRGVVVPLQVPVRCTCRGCGGRGETWNTGCLTCRGAGSEIIQHHIQVSVPAGVPDGARFYFTLTPAYHPPTRIELHVLVG